MSRRSLWLAAGLFAAAAAALLAPAGRAYVEAPMSLGAVVAQSSNVVLVRVEMVDKQKNLIVYRKVRDVKGKHPTDVIKHNIGRAGLRPDEWKPPIEWAEPGKLAVFFHNGGASETCIGNWWYQAYAGGEWWNHSHGEPYLLRSYCGSPEKLANLVAQMLENREVVVPCMVDGNKEDLHHRRAKIQRLKASLKLQDYNPRRDFVGWGGEDFRRLLGMAGFTHLSPLPRTDPEAQAVAVADFDGDGKLDLCLVGGGRVAVVQNGGESLNELALPGVAGARAAVWADYNGDGRPDLLVVTPSGPRLFTNLPAGFREDTHLLPASARLGATAAAWLDYDGDGRPDLLVAHGYHGLRLYRNDGGKGPPAAAAPVRFTDVSAQVGLGPSGIASDRKGDALSVCDVNGDGIPDFLYAGVLALGTRDKQGGIAFAAAPDSGIAWPAGKVSAAFGDFDDDGIPDLVLCCRGGIKLLHGDGKGGFADVTAKAGALAEFAGWATGAAWGDVDNDGRLDLVVSCLRGPNRYFRNAGDGTFEDRTAEIGLAQKVFNSQAVSLVDLNNDGQLDMVFNNEGQDSVVLLASRPTGARKVPLTLTLKAGAGVIGSRVEVRDAQGKVLGVRQVSGGDGRGGQVAPQLRFTLDPGTYQVQVRLSSGELRTRDITLGDDPLRAVVGEPPASASAK